eukprot:g2353.t1
MRRLERVRFLINGEEIRIGGSEPEAGAGASECLTAGCNGVAAADKLRLNPVVQDTLKRSLSSGIAVPWTTARQRAKRQKHALAPEKLAEWARERWERVLFFMVRALGAGVLGPRAVHSGRQQQAALSAVVVLLRSCGLVEPDPNDDAALTGGAGAQLLRLTQQGFEFVLQGRSAQLWRLVRELILAHDDDGGGAPAGAGGVGVGAADVAGAAGAVASTRVPADEVLAFLFRLGHCNVGQPCACKALAAHERALLPSLFELGVVFMSKVDSKYFYPTPMAAVLVFGRSAAGAGGAASSSSASAEAAGGSASAGAGAPPGAATGSDAGPELALIVETNFKVYAFTTSELHAHLLRFFVDVEYRLPNLVVGEITRESALDAFDHGITVDRIIHFLDTHAHERVLGRAPITPANVTHQLRLWAKEDDRFDFKPSHLYHNFSSTEEFESARQYAADIRALLWCSAPKKMFCVTQRGHKQMRDWFQQRRKRKLEQR